MIRFLCIAPLALAVFPRPPVQTADQLETFARINLEAQRASQAATPLVLAFLNCQAFRSMLESCCPAMARWSAEELLQRYRAEVQVAELAHATPAAPSRLFHDVTLKQLGEMSWFLNEFQTALIRHDNMSKGSPLLNDVAQKDIFGCKPFAGPVPTWSEASSRLIYTVHNMRRLDTGSKPLFGDVIVVFNSSHLKNAVVIAPHDTGLFTMLCFHPEVRPPQFDFNETSRHLNCSAWPKGLPMGTLEHFDHLILPNLAAGANCTATNRTMLDAARDLFTRSGISEVEYQSLPAVEDGVMSEYMEADILANPRLPASVKFVMGKFPTLFGTAVGKQLKATAQRLNWPLFWALGDGNPSSVMKPGIHGGEFYSGNHRMADPDGMAATNASISSKNVANFHEIWQQAAALRADRNATVEDVKSWWDSLEQIAVAPITATSCGDWHNCVAVDLTTKDCICVKRGGYKSVTTRPQQGPDIYSPNF